MKENKKSINDLGKDIVERLNSKKEMSPYILISELLKACDESIEGTKNKVDVKRRHEVLDIIKEIDSNEKIKNTNYEITYYIEALDKKNSLSREDILCLFKNCFTIKSNVNSFLTTMDKLNLEKNISFILDKEFYLTIVENSKDKYVVMIQNNDKVFQTETVTFTSFIEAFVCVFIYLTIGDYYLLNTNIRDFINKRQLKDIKEVLMKNF